MFDFLFYEMEQPKPFGIFHLFFFFLVIIFTVLLIIYYRNSSDKVFRRILFIFWIIIVLLEGMKQIINNYDNVNNIWKPYNYAAFPYQFCSLVFYTLPLIVFLKDSKIRDLLLVFSATFIFFGGFGYFFFPVSFCNNVLINIQTMVHHGVQIITGIYIYVHEYNKMSYRGLLKSTLILITSIIISMILNVVFYNISTSPESVNMFELSPINPTSAPVFSDILNSTNYPIFLLIYILGFTGFASIFYFIFKVIYHLFSLLTSRKNSNIVNIE